MHSSPLLISSFLLLAPAVLAVPREFRRSLLEKRAKTEAITNSSGAALVQAEGTVRYVLGTLTLPMSLSGQIDSSGIVQISIDSLGQCEAGTSLQTGILFQHTALVPAYQAYYWWYPSEPQLFPLQDIGTISPGDIIDLMIEVPTNDTYGVVIINNRNTTRFSWQDIQSNHALCLKSAEWIIRLHDSDSNTVLPNFGSIVFQNASAIGYGGDMYGPQATIYDIQQNGKNLTSVQVNENSVDITYTG